MTRRHRLLAISAAGVVLIAVVAVLISRLAQPSASDAAVLRDFQADQQAEVQALANGDPSTLRGKLTGNALQDLDSAVAGSRVQETISEQSAEVLRAPDPNDASVLLEVRQQAEIDRVAINGDGTRTTLGSEEADGRYWLRPVAGHLAIADQQVTTSSAIPQGPPWPLTLTAPLVAALGFAAAMWLRRRRASITPAIPVQQPVSAPALLEIRLCGGLQLLHQGRDLASGLRERPTQSLVWLLVLLEGLEGRKVSRDELGDETYPGLDPETRRRRVRNLLATMRAELPPPLGELLVSDRTSVGLELSRCTVDVTELTHLGQRLHGNAAPASLAADAQAALERTLGEVLPFWESLVDQVTEGRGAAADRVTRVRQAVAATRITLQMSLAEAALLEGAYERAAALLKEAHEQRPDREDVGRRLAAAYRLAGRENEARELLGSYS